MKKFLFLTYAVTWFLLFSLNNSAVAVVAYPFPIEFKQPDGKLITITLKGDERLSWAVTLDGYTLLSNGKNGWEYAVGDVHGNIHFSGVLAHEKGSRNADELNFLKSITKGLMYSTEQIDAAKKSYEENFGADQLIGSGSFVKGNNSQASNTNGLKSAKVFTPSGEKKLIMILIQFHDVHFTKTQADFAGLMNTHEYSGNGAHGSVKDYFSEASYGQFDLTTDVAPHIYTAKYNMAYYGADVTINGITNKYPKAGELMTEAILAADADGVDFSQYDNDGDGAVDGVYVVFAGYSQASGASTDALWSHAGTISPALTLDGKTISKYSCSNELTGNSGTNITTIGVICHEFGHVCGAPDFYDTDYEDSGEFPGTGQWDVMCYGIYAGTPSGSQPTHFNPLTKINFGWITPVTLSGSTSLSIPDVTTNKVVYVYNTSTPGEYYLLENRQKNGFNAASPGHGLLIYHYSSVYWNAHANKSAPSGFYLVSANCTASPNASSDPADYGSVNADSAPFPGTGNKTSFTDTTTPSAKSWAGANTGLTLTNIAESGGNITLCFNGCPTINSILGFTATTASATQINLSWLNSTNVIIARNTTNTFGTPVTGTSYAVGNTLSGGGEIVYTGTSSSFNNNGLSAATTYYYQIWATDGTNYSIATQTNAKTTCAAIATPLYTEGFESGLSSCWTQEYNIGAKDWVVQTGGYTGGSSPATAHSGSKNVCLFGNASTAYVTKLISPPLDLSSAANPVLKFWHTQQNWNGRQDILRIYYRTTALDSWKLLTTYTNSIDTWTNESVTLPNPSSSYYIAFEGTTAYGLGTCIDDVEVWRVGGTNQWTGTTSTDWFTATNWSAGVVPTSTNDVKIPAGTPFLPIIAASGAVCQNITIDANATLSMNLGLSVNGNLINNGILNGGSSTVNITGNWMNNGTFNYQTSTINFNGTNDLQIIDGTAATIDFYNIKVTKGAQSRVLEVKSVITLKNSTVSTTTPLQLASGTFKLSSASTITPFSWPTLGSNAALQNNGGTVTISGFYISGATFKNTTGTSTISSLSVYGAGGQVVVDGGTVNILNYFGPYDTSSTATYTQTGGSFVVNSSGSTTPFNLNSASTFNMSGGSIVVQKASGAAADYQNLASTSTVTGGTLQIGNGNTTSNQTVRINSTVPIYNLVVNSYNSPTAQLVSNNTTVNKDVIIGSGSKIKLNALNLSLGGNWVNNGGLVDGTATGTVTFNGSAAQSIGGSASTTFSDLVVDTESGVTTTSGITTTVSNNLIINSGKKLIVSPGSNLTVTTLVNNSDATGLVIKSDASSAGSVIVANTTTATATFESYVVGSKWHNVSPAVSGGLVKDFLLNSTNGIPSKNVSGTMGYGMMSYNETTNLWNDYYDATTNDNLNAGQGYSLRRSTDGVVSYVGAITSGPKTITLTNAGLGWNCIGNPYTSAISTNPAATTTDNFLKANAISTSNLDPAYACIYVWDEDSKSYKIIGSLPTGLTSERTIIQNYFQSGQGFFVKARTSGSQITFTPQMQLHSTGVQLKSGAQPWPGFVLAAKNGEVKASTIFAFNSQMTKGLDPTYDAGLLRGSSGVELYSRLVDDNGIDFAIQCLPDKDFNKLVIPVGIESKAGGSVVFSADIQYLPAGCSVILEDKLNRKFTDLTSSTYQTTIESGSTGSSRFQIHTSYLTTGIKEGDLARDKRLAAYAVTNTEIRIQGSVNAGAKASLFDVAGRLILTNALEQGEFNVIHSQPLKTGVYLLSVKDNGAEKVFKIVVKE